MDNQPQNNTDVSGNSPQNQTGNKTSASGNRFIMFFLVSAILILISGFAGYFLGLKSNSTLSFLPPQTTTIPVKKIEVTPGKSNTTTAGVPTTQPLLIRKQEILAVGMVVATDGKTTITVRSEDNSSAVFKLAANLLIYPIEIQEGKPILGTQDKSQIKTGQKAAITLDLINDDYQVTNITYIKK